MPYGGNNWKISIKWEEIKGMNVRYVERKSGFYFQENIN